MSTIEIPFSDDREEAALSGRKTCTSRNKKYGTSGDVFMLGDKRFEILRIEQRTLEDVAYSLHRQEGFSSVEGFVDKWNELHPRKGYIPEQLVYVHFFEKKVG